MARYRVTVTNAITAASDLVPHLSGAEFTHMHAVAIYIEKIMELGVVTVTVQQVTPFDEDK